MTDLIRAERLLPTGEVDRIVRDAPLDLVRFQDVAAAVPLEARAPLATWIDRFAAETRATPLAAKPQPELI